MSERRKYKDEPYLRAEHLLHDGKYVAATVTIADVVYDCPGKSGEKMKLMKGLAFANSEKVFGLNKTNESLVCIQTGHGKPEKWVGCKVQLVVRLVERFIGKQKVEEPAIRVWPNKPIPNGRLRDEMGKEITEAWYAANGGKVEKPATEEAK